MTTVRAADWIMEHLTRAGITHAFMVAGGGAMHLNDAAGAQPGLTTVCTLHEQGAAIAAESYTKAFGRLALTLVTTGPGATNAITGVAGGWLDSTPMIVVSGQVKRADLVGSTGVRQRGVQEVDITAMVRPITKDAVLITDPAMVRYHVDRALWLATSGRPGPVWLDIPLDVQAAPVDPTTMAGFVPPDDAPPYHHDPEHLGSLAAEILEALAGADRPLLLVGAGVRIAGVDDQVRWLAETLQVPVLTTWPAHGVLGEDHDLFVGRPGSLAARGANFALQTADVLVCLGARLDMVTTGYDPARFGQRARKLVVDIDPAELAKLEGAADRRICADLAALVPHLTARAESRPPLDAAAWRARCRDWRERYPVVTDAHRAPGAAVSTYHLADTLSDLLAPDDVLAPCSSGLALEIFLLALRLHTGQRAVYTTALGAMGYGPPAAIGACLASGGRRTVCIDGDGGLQLNVQELETIRRLELPVKLLVLANDGYASIRASQQRWFGRLCGADAASGMTLPPLAGIAAAYGLPYVAIDPSEPLAPQLRAVLDRPGPVVCEVPTPADEPREPVQTSEATPDGGMRSRPLEDLAPLLPREELAENMAALPDRP